MQQVEASPAIKPIPKVPIPKEPCLLDFSGEDFLPALIDVSIKEEDEVEEEKADGEDEGNPNGEIVVLCTLGPASLIRFQGNFLLHNLRIFS